MRLHDSAVVAAAVSAATGVIIDASEVSATAGVNVDRSEGTRMPVDQADGDHSSDSHSAVGNYLIGGITAVLVLLYCSVVRRCRSSSTVEKSDASIVQKLPSMATRSKKTTLRHFA